MPIYSTDGAYISYAIGLDLTAWRNADAVLIATELQATDKIDAHQNIAVDYTDPETEETGHMSSSQYKIRHTTSYQIGKVVLPMFLQTGVPLYTLLGACTSVDTVAEITTVECVTKLLCIENSTFHFFVSDGAGAQTEYYVWINKGTGADPTETGTAIEADISGATTAIDVAEVIDGLIDAKANVGAENGGTATITITNAQAGGVTDCSSSEGTSTGFTIVVTTQGSTTHTITLASSQTPISYALHFEKELTGQDDRYDFLGYMPDSWNLSCGDDKSKWKARQKLSAGFAYSRATAGDLAEPTKDDTPIYEWNDLKHASGVLTVKYNGTALEFTVRSIDLTLTRTNPLWGVRDGNYPSEAFISGMGVDLSLEGNLTGDNVRSLMATKAEDYVGTGLDVEFKFYKATNNEWGISLGNLYLIPDETILNEIDWYERKTLRLVPIGSTTTVSASVEDRKNKTYYEND